MTENTKKKLIFIHPAIRPYRQELFEILSEKLDIEFIFVEDWEDNLAELPKTIIKKWKVYKSIKLFLYSKGVTFKIIKDALWGEYDYWVASGLWHFTTHLAFFLVKLRGKKFIISSEDWWESKRLKFLLVKFLMGKIAQWADAIVVASQRSRNYFLKIGVHPAKIFIGTNATSDYSKKILDPVRFEKLRKTFNPEEKFVFLYLGRIVKYKGLDVLLQACKKLGQENFRLLVFGSGLYEQECKLLSAELGLTNVVFGGKIKPEDVHYYYRLAKVFILPARFLPSESVVAEAWGFTVNEAMSLGLVPIVTEAVAASEIIQNGKNGFIVKSEDVEGLAKTIKQCISDSERLKKMAMGAKQILTQVSPQKQAEAFLNACDQVERGGKL